MYVDDWRWWWRSFDSITSSILCSSFYFQLLLLLTLICSCFSARFSLGCIAAFFHWECSIVSVVSKHRKLTNGRGIGKKLRRAVIKFLNAIKNKQFVSLATVWKLNVQTFILLLLWMERPTQNCPYNSFWFDSLFLFSLVLCVASIVFFSNIYLHIWLKKK